MSEGQMLAAMISVAGALVLTIWGLMRGEAKRTADALEKKASNDAVKELREHFAEQVREINRRQDREVDWLKAEMGRINSSLSEMRQESNAANALITQNIQQLSLIIQRGRRADP